MSIPLTASTEKFTPACMAEIEGAPAFTFRHATKLDKHRYHNLVIEEGLRYHSEAERREAIIEALRTDFYSEGMDHNITRLEAYWHALDELKAARNEWLKQVVAIMAEVKEGEEKPDLPPEPVIDFPAEEIPALDEIVEEVRAHSAAVRKMESQNHWHGVMMPRLLLRMFLTGTSLPVKLRKADGILTGETAEAVIEELAQAARDLGVSDDDAVSELQAKAMLSYTLSESEEKNSSSPRSDTTSPAQSQNKESSGKTDSEASKSTDPATGDGDSGSNSSE